MRHGGHMKKLIAISLSAVMFISATACSADGGESDATTDGGTAVSTTEESRAPMETVHISTVIDTVTLDEVTELISTVKSEYAASEVMKLSDGSEVSAEVKCPDITEEDVASGAATKKQMQDYMVYMSNIRTVVCDRLCEYFPEDNKVITDGSGTADYLFLDPLKDGFINANQAFSAMIGTSLSSAAQADYILVVNGSAAYFKAGTTDNMLLCPSTEENQILMAIRNRLDPDSAESK